MPCWNRDFIVTNYWHHRMTVTLSEKDLVRWNRAAAAFSRDLREELKTIGTYGFVGPEDIRSAAGNYFVENRALNLRLADFAALWPGDDHRTPPYTGLGRRREGGTCNGRARTTAATVEAGNAATVTAMKDLRAELAGVKASLQDFVKGRFSFTFTPARSRMLPQGWNPLLSQGQGRPVSPPSPSPSLRGRPP